MVNVLACKQEPEFRPTEPPPLKAGPIASVSVVLHPFGKMGGRDRRSPEVGRSASLLSTVINNERLFLTRWKEKTTPEVVV